MQLPNNTKQRSVSITTNKHISIGRQLSDIVGMATSYTLGSQAEVDEEKTPFLLAQDVVTYAISNKIDRPLSEGLSCIIKGVQGIATVGAALAEVGSSLQAASTGDSFGSKWNPWFNNVPTWKSTDLQGVELTFEFALGQYGLWNAREEVLKPTLALLLPVMPKNISPFMMKGPFPSTVALLGKFIEAVGEMGGNSSTQLDGLSGKLSATIADALSTTTYTIAIGNVITLMYSVPTKASVTMSTDLDDKNIPISSKVSLTFEGVVPPSLETSGGVPTSLRFGRGGQN